MLYYLKSNDVNIKAIWLTLVIFIFSSFANTSFAQKHQGNSQARTLHPDVIKSATIVQIINNTQWPDDYQSDEFNMAFISNDDKLFKEMQTSISKYKLKIDGKPLKVSKTTLSSVDARKYEVIYVGIEYKSNISRFANKIRQTNTLLLSTGSDAKRDIMINFLEKDDNSHHFEVNRSNIIFEKLTISKQVLLLGGTELDVAHLLRESEQHLQTIRNELTDKQTELIKKEADLRKTTTEVEAMQNKVNTQQQLLKNNRTQISKMLNELKNKEQQLADSEIKLKTLDQQSEHVAKRLAVQREALSEQTQRNEQQLDLIREQQQKLDKLNANIIEKENYLKQQDIELNQQKNQLLEQNVTIDIQRKRIWLIVAILIGFITLLGYILKINKDRINAHASTKASRAKLLTLADIGNDLTAHLELEQVLDKVYQNLNRVLDANVFIIGILQQDQNRIFAPLVVENRKKLSHISYCLDDDLRPAVWCVKNKKELVILEYDDQIRLLGQPMQTIEGSLEMQTVVYQPLCIDDNIIGCLSVQSPEAHAYNEEELDLIKTLANYIAVAVSNALGFTELDQQKRKLEAQHQTLIETQHQLVQSEKFASLGTLTAGVAHEINNPINFAQVGAQNLQTDVTKLEEFILEMADDDADQEIIDALKDKFIPLYQHVETINEGTSRISTIVKDLRSFTNHDQSDKMTVNINDGLKSTVSLIKSSYANITEIIEQYQPLPAVSCYPAKLNQVFMNLIVNANHAIGEKIKNKDLDRIGTITITSKVQNDNIVIAIKDNGTGIDELTQKRIFEPFYTTKDVGEGTGLGLSISYGIIQEHQGTLSLTSTLGIGSEFTITLPINAEKSRTNKD